MVIQKTAPDPQVRPSVVARKASKKQIRDPEKAKSDLLASAIKEFAEKGFANAGIEAIADGAGLNKRMIYHYFGSKEDLYMAVLEKVYTDIRANEASLGLEELDPVSAVRALVESTWEYLLNTPELLAIVSLENTHRGAFIRKSETIHSSTFYLLSALGRILDEGAKQGIFRKDIDPIQLMHSIAGMSFYYINNRFTNAVIYNVDLLSDEALATRRKQMVEMVLAYLKPESALD